jgi:hypothetical protein
MLSPPPEIWCLAPSNRHSITVISGVAASRPPVSHRASASKANASSMAMLTIHTTTPAMTHITGVHHRLQRSRVRDAMSNDYARLLGVIRSRRRPEHALKATVLALEPTRSERPSGDELVSGLGLEGGRSGGGRAWSGGRLRDPARQTAGETHPVQVEADCDRQSSRRRPQH